MKRIFYWSAGLAVLGGLLGLKGAEVDPISLLVGVGGGAFLGFSTAYLTRNIRIQSQSFILLRSKVVALLIGLFGFILAIFAGLSFAQGLPKPQIEMGAGRFLAFYFATGFFFTYFILGALSAYATRDMDWVIGIWLAILPTIILMLPHVLSPRDTGPPSNELGEYLSYTPLLIPLPLLGACTGAFLVQRIKRSKKNNTSLW